MYKAILQKDVFIEKSGFLLRYDFFQHEKHSRCSIIVYVCQQISNCYIYQKSFLNPATTTNATILPPRISYILTYTKRSQNALQPTEMQSNRTVIKQSTTTTINNGFVKKSKCMKNMVTSPSNIFSCFPSHHSRQYFNRNL